MNIRSIAKKATVIAEIMENRTKGSTEELIDFKDPVTIVDCELCRLTNEKGEQENVWAFVVKEFPDLFFFAGYVMKKIFDTILAECNGDFADLYSCLNEQGLTVKFGQAKTKDGKRNVTTVEVL